MPEPIFIALGTNLGDRQANLQKAVEALAAFVRVIQESHIYVTPPWGYEDQPEFLNQVIEVRSELAPVPLLRAVKNVESRLGREKTFLYGPRLIDIDILFYGQRVVQEEDLQIPHPRLHERAFVLVPLAEIAPDFVHPILKKTVKSLLSNVNPEGISPL